MIRVLTGSILGRKAMPTCPISKMAASSPITTIWIILSEESVRFIDLISDRKSQFVFFAVSDRRLIRGGVQLFLILCDAPPFLIRVVGSFAVHGSDKHAVSAFFSWNEPFFCKEFSEVFQIRLILKSFLGGIFVDDIDRDGLFALHRSRPCKAVYAKKRSDNKDQSDQGNKNFLCVFLFCFHKFLHSLIYKSEIDTHTFCKWIQAGQPSYVCGWAYVKRLSRFAGKCRQIKRLPGKSGQPE